MSFDITSIIASANAIGSASMTLLVPLSALLGVWLIGTGLKKLVADPYQRGEVDLQAVAVRILIGGVLVQFGTSMNWTRSLLGGAGGEVRSAVMLAVGGSASTSIVAQIFSASLLWVAAIGAYGMLKGFYMWGQAGGGESQAGGKDLFWGGLWHILGGGLAINIGTS